MNPFVTGKLIAQTGNQLFIMATVIATALRNGAGYLLPRETSSRKLWPCYIKHLPEYKGEKIDFIYEEPRDFSFKPVPYRPNMMLSGYFQSEKHFADYREEILDALNFPYELKEGYVSIHVRRGDYVKLQDKHPPVTLMYLAEAMSYMFSVGYWKFLVFSDDMRWCKEHLNETIFPSYHFEYSEGRSTMEDLTLMSHCESNIIANSTFSWWGAWLNRNPNKIVISPSSGNWFGVGNRQLCADHIIPESWHQIKYGKSLKHFV